MGIFVYLDVMHTLFSLIWNSAQSYRKLIQPTWYDTHVVHAIESCVFRMNHAIWTIHRDVESESKFKWQILGQSGIRFFFRSTISSIPRVSWFRLILQSFRYWCDESSRANIISYYKQSYRNTTPMGQELKSFNHWIELHDLSCRKIYKTRLEFLNGTNWI